MSTVEQTHKDFGATGAKDPLIAAALVALVAIVSALAWVGYYGSDDMSYIAGALGWLNDFPFVGYDHWTLRHSVTVPTAISIAVLGYNEFAFVLPMILYFVGTILVSYHFGSKMFGRQAAVLLAVILATVPLFAVDNTRIVADPPEVFAIVASFWMFFFAAHRPRQTLWLFSAGLVLGIGWLTRETTIIAAGVYGILFLFGYRYSRVSYLWLAAGFLLIVGLEFLYFWATAGNPLHRLVVDFGTHLKVEADSTREAFAGAGERLTERFLRRETQMYGELARTGNLALGSFFDPALVVLVNHEFVLLYYIGIPLTAWMAFSQRLSREARSCLRVLILLAGVWFFFLWFQIGMSLLPRYFMVPTYVVCWGIALGLSAMLDSGRRLIPLALLAALLAGNVAGVMVANRTPDYAERQYRDYVATHQVAVKTDPETHRRGYILYEIAGIEDYVAATPPEEGDLFFYNQKYQEWMSRAGSHAGRLNELLAPFRVQPSWEEVWRQEPQPTLHGRIAKALGADAVIPGEIWRRLYLPDPVVVVYRVR